MFRFLLSEFLSDGLGFGRLGGFLFLVVKGNGGLQESGDDLKDFDDGVHD